MATALDLLMSTKEDVNLLFEESDICTIDAKTRAIFVPSTIVVGGVQSDKNAERIKFSCPKIVGDNLDLSKFSVRINFENVSSVDFNVSIKDQYICDDVAVDGENVTFSWLIGRNAARYMGTVRFIVCAVKTDSDSNISVEWNTAIAEVPVLEGIEIDQPQIGQEEKDVINQLLEFTKNTSAEAVQNVNSAKEQAIKDIQSVSQPDTTLTIEGGLAEAKATGEAIGSLKEDSINYLCFGITKEIEHTDTRNTITNTTTLATQTLSGFSTTEVSVSAGEAFIVENGYAGSPYNPCFASDTEALLQFSIGSEAIAPTGTTRLIANGRPSMNKPIVIKKLESNSKSKEFLEDYADLKKKVDNIKPSANQYKFGVSVGANNTIDVFVKDYEENRDFCMSIWQKASNNLPDIGQICSYPNDSDEVLIDRVGLTNREISGGTTDYLSPSTVYAVNNADGDFPSMTGGKLTGGWHGYNNAVNGATSTARNISCKVFCDGKEITEGNKARSNSVIIDIVNRLQGSNTEKQDGSGREIVEQHFRIEVKDDFTILVDGEIMPLEAIKYSTYYGVSCYHSMPNDVYFVGCRAKRNGQDRNNVNRCGDLFCTAIKQIGADDTLEMGYDNTYDLGLLYANKWANSFTMSSTKSYAVLIYGTTENDMLSLNEGDIVRWKGYYKAYPTT